MIAKFIHGIIITYFFQKIFSYWDKKNSPMAILYVFLLLLFCVYLYFCNTIFLKLDALLLKL